MVFEHIEKLQAEYTDKYVVVDEECPELRRFQGMTGQVKTVNLSGRALVQFDAHNNIGWYDIDVDYLKVVDKPLPKEEPKLTRRAAAPKPADKPADKPAVAAPEPAKSPSVDDVLAAARAAKAASSPPAPAKAAPAAGAAKDTAVDDILAAARAQKAAQKPLQAVKAPPQKSPGPTGAPKTDISVDDILAAARGGSAASVKPVAKKSKESPPADEKPAARPVKKKGTPRPGMPTDVASILAYCRKSDAKK